MQKPWRSRKVPVEKNNGRYNERDPTGCEIFWRSGVEERKKAMMKSEMKKMEQQGQKTKGGRSMKKKNEKRDEEEHQDDEEVIERGVKNACFSPVVWER